MAVSETTEWGIQYKQLLEPVYAADVVNVLRSQLPAYYCLKHRSLAVCTVHEAKCVTDFAQCCVGSNGIKQVREAVVRTHI